MTELKESTSQILRDARVSRKKIGLPTAAERRAAKEKPKPKSNWLAWVLVAALCFVALPLGLLAAVIVVVMNARR